MSHMNYSDWLNPLWRIAATLDRRDSVRLRNPLRRAARRTFSALGGVEALEIRLLLTMSPVDDLFPTTTSNHAVTIDVLANDYVTPAGLEYGTVNVTSASSTGTTVPTSFADGSTYYLYRKQEYWTGTLGSGYTWSAANLPYIGQSDGSSTRTITWGGTADGTNNQFALFKNGVIVAVGTSVTYSAVIGTVLGASNFKLESDSFDVQLIPYGAAGAAANIPPHSTLHIGLELVDGLYDPGDPPPDLHGAGGMTIGAGDRTGFEIAGWQTNSNTHGTVDWSSDHTQLVYTPASGYTGGASFTYQIAFAGQISPAIATVLINVQNAGPLAVNDTRQPVNNNRWEVAEGGFIDINFLANDSPGQGRVWRATPLSRFPTNPAHGVVTYIPGTRTIRYQASGNYTGPDSFQYEVVNDLGQLATARVDVYVTPVNDPPVVQPPALIWDIKLGAAVDSVVARAYVVDPDMNELITFQIVGGNGTGLFKIDDQGFISLTRTLTGTIGNQFLLQVQATDRAGTASAAVIHTLRIVANLAEAGPTVILNGQNQTVYMNTPKPIIFSAIERGAPSSSLAVAVTSSAGAIVVGTPVVTRSGNTFTLTYALTTDAKGSFVFTIKVTDNDGQISSNTVTITVVDPIDLVDWNFTAGQEGTRTEAYFPYPNDAGGKGAGSGVTIATGFDFGGNNAASIRALIPGDVALQNKLINSGYLGLRGNAANDYLNSHVKLTLTNDEVTKLDLAKRRQVLRQIITQYDSAAEQNGLNGFWSIPTGAATAIFDRWWWAGSIPSGYNYWKQVTQGDWQNAAYELRHWKGGLLNSVRDEGLPTDMTQNEMTRLNAEAALVGPN